MTKKELWRVYADKNPSFDGKDKITLSASGLRKLFNQTWDIAFYDGEPEEDERDVYTSTKKSDHDYSATLDDLKNLFKMR